VNEFSREQVDWCFAQNKDSYQPAGPKCSDGEMPANAQ